MRKQHRIAASLAAVLLSSAAVTTTDATATAESQTASPLVDVPTYPLRGFRFGGGEPYLTAAAAPAPPAPARVVPQRASRQGRSVGAASGDAFARLRQCESGGNYAANTGNGYYGAYQFSLSTWRSLGYAGYPHTASPATQDEAARRLQARSGWGQWPSCARRLGLR